MCCVSSRLVSVRCDIWFWGLALDFRGFCTDGGGVVRGRRYGLQTVDERILVNEMN